jgi:hypothetical protein
MVGQRESPDHKRVADDAAAKAVAGMKIPRQQCRAGSTPAPGTIIENQPFTALGRFSLLFT